MYRIRFHGRGGQGMKTASRILGSALFIAGYEVQDAPRYGAERRGAPIFAYVRADRAVINERGVIHHPDLVVVADDSLVPVPAAGILHGVNEHTVILLNSDTDAATWKHRLNHQGEILILPRDERSAERSEMPYVGARCAGAAACLCAVIEREALDAALELELSGLGTAVLEKNRQQALSAFDAMLAWRGCVQEGQQVSVEKYDPPKWVELPFEQATTSAPAIHAAATSVMVKTGLWRTQRPVIDYDLCKHCWWVCSSYCPDGAIAVNESRPVIDYDHCKGCLICVAQCPPHAIAVRAERDFVAEQAT